MRHVLPTALLASLLALPLAVRSQALDAADTSEIQQKALRHVRQFEGLLNLISQPDEYFRKYGFDALIRSYYDEQSSYRIFRDSLVVIEDDLNPRARVQRYGHLLTIQEYLKAFFSLYNKSPVTSVFFDRYRVSEVKQGDFTYVEVRYDSDFRNRHRAFPDVPYPMRARKATVRAERTPTGWQVIITDLSYDRSAASKDPVAVVPDVPQARRVASTTPTAAKATAKLPSASVSPVLMPIPDTTAVAVAASEPTFGPLPRTYRPGKVYQLPLSPQTSASDVSLLLYQNDLLIEDISAVLTDSSYAWRVPKQLDTGGDYHFRLYNPATSATDESAPFAIKRRARWPWVVGAAVVAVVIVAVTSSGNDASSNDELPAPPTPN